MLSEAGKNFVSARVHNLSFVGKCCLLRHFLLPLVEGNDLFKLTLPTSPSSRDGNTNLEIGWKRGRNKPVCNCALHGSSFLFCCHTAWAVGCCNKTWKCHSSNSMAQSIGMVRKEGGRRVLTFVFPHYAEISCG